MRDLAIITLLVAITWLIVRDELADTYTAAKTQHTHDTHRDNDMWLDDNSEEVEWR